MSRSFLRKSLMPLAFVVVGIAVFGCETPTTPNPNPSTSSGSGGVVTGNGGPAAVLTYHNDLSRDGQNLSETTLTRSNVNSTSFGKIGVLPVDGLVYAQPLYVPNVTVSGASHNVVYVVTEHDSVYAFDADSLSTTPLWRRNFVNDCVTSPSTPSNCSTATAIDVGAPNVSPEIGITSTPVIDEANGIIYVVAFTKESGLFYWRLHAMSIATGAEESGSPITIDAGYPGTGEGEYKNGLIYFDPGRQLSRAGLVLNNGLVYVPFSSFDDQEPVHGWMMAYNASTLDPVSTWMGTPNSGEGTIWMAGGAPAVDNQGNLFFATGNGEGQYFQTNGVNNGFVDLSDSVVKLNFGMDGFEVADYFTPYNFVALAVGDVEVGSGGVLLLPDQPGQNPHLLMAGGKQGTVYLLNRDNLGKLTTGGATPGDPQIVQELVGKLPGGADGGPGIYSTPSYYNGAVFIAGAGDYLRKIPLSNGLLNWSSMTKTSYQIEIRGATTSISANGNSDGIIWYMDPSAYTYNWTSGYPTTSHYGPPILYAFSTDDLSTPLYTSSQVSNDAAGCPASTGTTPGSATGCAVKFAVPTVVAGKVFVGTDTEISVYGLRTDVAANDFHPEQQATRAIASVKGHGVAAPLFKFRTENSCPLHKIAKAAGALF